MTEPKGPKPGAGRYPGSTEPHFDQGSGDQPMYATEPQAPSPSRGSAGASGASYGGGWDVPAGPDSVNPRREQRQPDRAHAASAGDGGQAGTGGPGSAAPEPAGSSAAADVADAAEQGQPGQRSAQSSQGAAAPAEGQAELRALLAAAEADAKENHEQYLRALADMENVRRRAQEDVSKAHKFAIESFAESMLPVRDSLEMALTVEVPSIENLREGVEATLRQLTSAFERNRVVVLDPLHHKFDPNLHQAISMAPSKDVPANHVVSVLQKGYMINDRILRPALVTVSKPA